MHPATLLLLCWHVSADKMPSMYEMQDYDSCMVRNDLYCKADARLVNGNENSYIWKLINMPGKPLKSQTQEMVLNQLEYFENEKRNGGPLIPVEDVQQKTVNHRYYFDRSIIHRAICVSRKKATNEESLRNIIEMDLNTKLREIDLQSQVEDLFCIKTDHVKLSLYDKLLMLIFVVYVCLILYATIYDKQQRTWTEGCGGSVHRILVSLSIISNWKKLWKVDGNEDYRRLKFVQGFRVFTMFFILICHSFLNYGLFYIANPEDIEKVFKIPLIEYMFTLHLFAVQCFFFISSWILTFQIYNIYNDNGIFTAKQGFILFINRYFRISVCSCAVILFTKSSWLGQFANPINFNAIIYMKTVCTENWWKTLLLINNYSYFGDICNMVSWYVSVDFQLYLAAIVTLYIILKFKMTEWKVIGFLFCLSYVLYGLFIYFHEMDIIFRPAANLIKIHALKRSEGLRISYTSVYANWSTSIVGIGFGTVYAKNKDFSFTNRKIISTIWVLLFFNLCFTVILIAMIELEGITASVLGPLFKPLFSVGLGVGILGMSYNIGGFLKRTCENRWILLISNFSFSIYIFQLIPLMLTKAIGAKVLMEFGIIEGLTRLIFLEVPVCVFVGVIGALIFEQPGVNLQKMFLPQISYVKKKL